MPMDDPRPDLDAGGDPAPAIQPHPALLRAARRGRREEAGAGHGSTSSRRARGGGEETDAGRGEAMGMGGALSVAGRAALLAILLGGLVWLAANRARWNEEPLPGTVTEAETLGLTPPPPGTVEERASRRAPGGAVQYVRTGFRRPDHVQPVAAAGDASDAAPGLAAADQREGRPDGTDPGASTTPDPTTVGAGAGDGASDGVGEGDGSHPGGTRLTAVTGIAPVGEDGGTEATVITARQDPEAVGPSAEDGSVDAAARRQGDGDGGGARTAGGGDSADRPKPWKDRAITGPIPGAYLLLWRSRKALCLVAGKEYVRVYHPVRLPPDLTAPKRARGDKRLPLGAYRIADMKPGPDGTAILILSYPSLQDADRAFVAKRIDRAERDRIALADFRKRKPVLDSVLGGPVRIVALPAGRQPTGSEIAVTPKQMEEIFRATQRGTPIRIQP